MSTFSVADALQMQQWEIAKGHLNALVSVYGAYHSGSLKPPHEIERYSAIKKFDDAFSLTDTLRGETPLNGASMFKLDGYQSHATIKMDMAV